MEYPTYESLVAALEEVGLSGQQGGRADQLIVSAQEGAVWPDRGNSFWLTLRDGAWILCTWAPVGYRVPEDEDVLELCVACMNSGSSAMWRVPEDLVARFSLEELSSEEFERVVG